MKKILSMGIIIFTLVNISVSSAEVGGTVTKSSSIPAAYNSAEVFLEAEGATCKTASDGCNTLTIENGKFGASTLMACENQIEPVYSCVSQKEEEIMMCTMEYAPVCGADGTTYSNSCMAGNVEIVSENECEAEKSKLSDNDLSFYNTIKTKVDTNFQTRVDDVLGNYIKRVNILRWSDERKGEFHKKMIQKVETMISEHLMKYPQDIALPDAANDKYLKLSLIKFELVMLDM